MRNVASVLLLLCVWGGCAGALAQAQPVRFNVVELQAEVQREAPNDLMAATLFVEQGDASPAALANTLNRTLAEALKVARDTPAVKVRTGNNQTYPVYAPRTNQLQGWRGRAELRLETRDFAAGSALIGKLQATLQLAGINFSVSPEARRSVENELIAEAIAAFRARAEIAQKALAGKGFKLQKISISTGSSGPPPRLMLAQARAASMADGVAPPPAEAGSSIISVNVNGAVEIE